MKKLIEISSPVDFDIDLDFVTEFFADEIMSQNIENEDISEQDFTVKVLENN